MMGQGNDRVGVKCGTNRVLPVQHKRASSTYIIVSEVESIVGVRGRGCRDRGGRGGSVGGGPVCCPCRRQLGGPRTHTRVNPIMRQTRLADFRHEDVPEHAYAFGLGGAGVSVHGLVVDAADSAIPR
jgi:hypothetical protein